MRLGVDYSDIGANLIGARILQRIQQISDKLRINAEEPFRSKPKQGES
jgi:hypothetical protein